MASRPASERMFFIVGRGRSGTTLLSQLLDRHPGVCVAPEALFVMSLLKRYRAAAWDRKTVARFVRDLWLEERMTRWRVDAERLEARLRELLLSGEAGYAAVCAAVYAEEARARGGEGTVLLGDKNPHHSLFVEPLSRLFPRARFVHLVRDPRDNVLSFGRVPFDLSSVAGLSVRWVLYNRRVLQRVADLRDRYSRVRFEDLVARPTETLASVCGVLGIEPHRGTIEGAAVLDAAVLPWHHGLEGPIDTRQAGKWVESMPRGDVRLVEEICGDTARELGYPLSAAHKRLPRGLAGRVFGRAVTALEEILFELPLAVRWRVIRSYRRWTGNRIG